MKGNCACGCKRLADVRFNGRNWSEKCLPTQKELQKIRAVPEIVSERFSTLCSLQREKKLLSKRKAV